MKKYKIAKWLVLGIAAFTVISFFLPFLDCRVYLSATYNDEQEFYNVLYNCGDFRYFEYEGLNIGFIFFRYLAKDYILRQAAWLTLGSFIVAVIALALTIFPILFKNTNGFNTRGRIHWHLIIAICLSVVSAILNTVVMGLSSQALDGIEGSASWHNGSYEFTIGCKSYAWIYMIIIALAAVVAIVLLVMGTKKQNIDFCGYLEGTMTQGGKRSICISQGACLAWSAGNSDIVLSKETVKSVEPANKTVSDVVDGKRQNFDVYNITMADGQEGTLSLLQAHAGSVVRAMSDLVVVTESAAPRGERAKNGKATVSTGEPDSPNGKPLDWFKSEKGLEVYKAYITPQNYFLQETYLKEYKKMFEGEDTNVDFDRHFLPCSYPNAKLPRTYFNALLESIGTEPLYNGAILELFRGALLVIAKPYVINEDGEPELRETVLTPEQIVSTDENPLLYFIKNFNAFEMKDEATGSLIDKYFVYKAVVLFILNFVNEIVIEENKWLFDKNTYLNELGIVRKIKGFIKKCKELTDNERYNTQLDVILDILLSEMESSAQHRREDEGNRVLRQQAEEQRRYNEEQRRFNEQQAFEQRKQAEEQKKLMQKQMDEQKKAAQRQACAAGQCPRCRRQCGMVNFHSNGSGGCTWFQSK